VEDREMNELDKFSQNEIIDLAKKIISAQFEQGACINNTKVVKDYFLLHLAEQEKEVFYALFLNSQNNLLAFERISDGTVNNAAVYPREVVKMAFKYNATGIIFVHNHISGSVTPSAADKALTTDLKRLLYALEIRMLDHVIISGANTYSFAEEGIL
jgi:DNA repair protein RadC